MSSSPPHYVLLSHSNLTSHSSSNTSLNPAPTLTHPTIQYQFRDDPPLSLANSHLGHILVMDYDPASSQVVHVQSLSPQLAITSVRVTEAPGAASVGEDDAPKNTNMYVLETISHPPSEKGTASDDVLPVVSLASFKQRNSLLRKALEYPLPSGTPPPTAPAEATSPGASPSRHPPVLPRHSPTN